MGSHEELIGQIGGEKSNSAKTYICNLLSTSGPHAQKNSCYFAHVCLTSSYIINKRGGETLKSVVDMLVVKILFKCRINSIADVRQ